MPELLAVEGDGELSLVKSDGTSVQTFNGGASGAVTVTLVGPDVTGTGPNTAVTANLSVVMTTLAGAGTAALGRARLNFVAIMGPDATVEFPTAPLTGDVVALSFQFSGEVGAPPTTLANGGSGIPIQNPVIPISSGATIEVIDSAGLLFYVFDGTGQNAWMLFASNVSNTNFLGPATVPPNGAWSQQVWHINSATGNDTNAGTGAGVALKTLAEMFRRMGTLRPEIATAVVVNVDAAQTNGTDPWLLEPILLPGGSMTVQSANPASSAVGTINTVVAAKSQTGNTTLQITLNTTSGTFAVGQKVVNATRGNSIAYLQLESETHVWQVSQPMTPYSGTGYYSNTEVNTWAAGDAITAYVPNGIDAPNVGGRQADYAAAGTFAPGVIFWNLTIVDPQAAANDAAATPRNPCTIDAAVSPAFIECSFSRGPSWFGGLPPPAYFFVAGQFNCCGLSPINTIGTQQSMALVSAANNPAMVVSAGAYGNSLTSLAWAGVLFTNDVILGGDIFGGGQHQWRESSTASGYTYVDSGSTLSTFGDVSFAGTAGPYGPGTFNVAEGCVQSEGTVAEMATNFPIVNITFKEFATGYSYSTTAGVTTVHGGIALTGAHLAAAAGAAGFGGSAIGVGCSITTGAQP